MSKTKLGFSTGKGFIEKVDKAAQADIADITDFTNAEWIDGVDAQGSTSSADKYFIPRSALVMGATYEVRFYAKTSTSSSLAFETPVGSVIFNYFTPEDKNTTQKIDYSLEYNVESLHPEKFFEVVTALCIRYSGAIEFPSRVYVAKFQTVYAYKISDENVGVEQLFSSSDNKTTYYNLKYRRIR